LRKHFATRRVRQSAVKLLLFPRLFLGSWSYHHYPLSTTPPQYNFSLEPPAYPVALLHLRALCLPFPLRFFFFWACSYFWFHLFPPLFTFFLPPIFPQSFFKLPFFKSISCFASPPSLLSFFVKKHRSVSKEPNCYSSLLTRVPISVLWFVSLTLPYVVIPHKISIPPFFCPARGTF